MRIKLVLCTWGPSCCGQSCDLFRPRPGFDSLCARLSPPRCLTCSLGLQDVQWAVGNSRGARKLARTPHANQKKKKTSSLKENKMDLQNLYILINVKPNWMCMACAFCNNSLAVVSHWWIINIIMVMIIF